MLATLMVAMLQPALVAAPSAGAAPTALFKPVVVQSRTVAFNGHDPWAGVSGPRTLRVSFPHPTRRGTLLVASVIDGVRTSGMPQPRWRIAGWRLGAATIGGQLATTESPSTGGLQSVILFDPGNPGGVRTVRIGRVPQTTVTWVTVVLAELSGVPGHLGIAARGGSTNGPLPSDYTTASSVSSSAPLKRVPALVLASFTNGGQAPHGEHFVYPPPWRVLGADRSGNGVDQPTLVDERVWRLPTRPGEWMRYLGGSPIDNCAAIVALH